MNAMTDRKIPSPSPNKVAMSRALGAAFLNHQVEQLEKSVSAGGPASGNWRDRKQPPPPHYTSASPHHAKRAPMAPGIKIVHRKNGGDAPSLAAGGKPATKETHNGGSTAHLTVHHRTHSGGENREMDADIVVVDASVLVHALYQVKKWAREGRQEILIIPLEALNTLDLLKKGTSPLAQRARAASRVLESQVGTNPRIRVQRDEAFVLWDKILLNETPSRDDVDSKAASAPEWVRRTICCARWEVEHAEATIHSDGNGRTVGGAHDKSKGNKHYKVVLAVLSTPLNLSPLQQALKLADTTETPMAPVPLPAPSVPHPNKFEIRSSGGLVARWAEKTNIETFPVEPTLPGRGGAGAGEEDERPKRAHHSHHGPKGRRSSNTDHTPKACLVERPPAVMAMMEAVSQPSRVVRVLARGEKLEP